MRRPVRKATERYLEFFWGWRFDVILGRGCPISLVAGDCRSESGFAARHAACPGSEAADPGTIATRLIALLLCRPGSRISSLTPDMEYHWWLFTGRPAPTNVDSAP
jgi:hypothetical protein